MINSPNRFLLYFFYREAWHGLGKMTKQEAMESYVHELKQVLIVFKQVLHTLQGGSSTCHLAFSQTLKSLENCLQLSFTLVNV